MIPLDRAAVRLALALAGAGCPPVTTGTLAIIATHARDNGPEEVAGWVVDDPGWVVMPSTNTNQNNFGASLLVIGRFRTNGPPEEWRGEFEIDSEEEGREWFPPPNSGW